MKTKNTAAVMVTAMLPPFARRGSTIDVVVSSLGDAASLRGGTLIVTPLTGADGEVYAVAQGPIAVAGYAAQGINASIVEGVPTVARIENGATVENEVELRLQLARHRAARAARRRISPPPRGSSEAINGAIGPGTRDGARSRHDRGRRRTSKADMPRPHGRRSRTCASQPDSIAKVVIDARSGTIVIGADVRIDRSRSARAG